MDFQTEKKTGTPLVCKKKKAQLLAYGPKNKLDLQHPFFTRYKITRSREDSWGKKTWEKNKYFSFSGPSHSASSLLDSCLMFSMSLSLNPPTIWDAQKATLQGCACAMQSTPFVTMDFPFINHYHASPVNTIHHHGDTMHHQS